MTTHTATPSSISRGASSQKAKPKRPSTKRAVPQVFILWGEGFEATAATIFATVFRKQGIATKIVAARGNKSVGAYGIQLQPDITLGEAIAMDAPALAYIFPCSSAQVARIENDPRIHSFLQDKFTPSTHVVVKSIDTLERRSLAQLDMNPEQLSVYGDWSSLAHLVDDIVRAACSTL